MASKLLKAVSQQDSIDRAWRVILDNARGSTSDSVRQEVAEFGEEAGRRIRSICYRLSRGRFEFGLAKGIPLPKKDSAGRNTGKFRPIVLATIEARIVQRSVLEILMSVRALDRYINTPHSFGGVRKAKVLTLGDKRDNPFAVPAAIKAVLAEIEDGAHYYACADIKSFFTRIPKSYVTSIVENAVNDLEFIQLFTRAVTTELSNMAELREKALDFSIEDIGVAQGNSLSPLLGNIALAAFDQEMNSGDCRCIRYIDDFIILGSSQKAVNARLRKAVKLLADLKMELSPEKSSKGAMKIKDGFSFLGIEILPGIVRPSATARRKFLTAIAGEFAKSRKAFIEVQHGKVLPQKQSLISTLSRAQGMIDGWGKHYWFCNDELLLRQLDVDLRSLVRDFIGAYTAIRSKTASDRQATLLGIPSLLGQKRRPYAYPKTKSD